MPAPRQACGADAALFLIEYADGFRASLLHCQGAGNVVAGWAYSARVEGEAALQACSYNGNEAPNYPPFSYLCALPPPPPPLRRRRRRRHRTRANDDMR
jgi:hypothetical protein